MRLLLDTSYLYDIMDKPGAFLKQERRILAARDTEFHVSSVSLWELRLKYNARHLSGDRKSRFSPEDVISALADQEVKFLPMTIAHAVKELSTPLPHKDPFDELLQTIGDGPRQQARALPHKDPFDELLLVQAQEEGLKLLTADRLLVGHPHAVSARELQ